MRPIALSGFEAKFAGNSDPWSTFTDPDEALKRGAILHAMGASPWGRVLEIAAGNGSNSAAIGRRALRLDATEATATGTALVARAVNSRSGRARAVRLTVPARPPRDLYDIILVAEILYYLSARQMELTARVLTERLRPGGTLVLAHHRIDFPDFAQHAARIQRRFLAASGRRWHVRAVRRTTKWVVISCRSDRASAESRQKGRR